MDVSVIVPVFYGNQYIPGIIQMMQKNVENAKGLKIELVLVNDSPEIPLIKPEPECAEFAVKIVENNENQGILRSRSIGIMHSSGTYIVLLDQDDRLSDHALISQYLRAEGVPKQRALKKTAAVVANGYIESRDGNLRKIFRTLKGMELINHKNFWFYYGSMIPSPGLCMIRRDCISEIWMQARLETGGADDWLLWVLFLSEGHFFLFNNECLYTHVKVERNTSDNESMMLASSLEALQIYEKYYPASEKLSSVYRRKLNVRKISAGQGHWRKNIEYLKNPDILIALFRLKRWVF